MRFSECSYVSYYERHNTDLSVSNFLEKELSCMGWMETLVCEIFT